MANTLDPSFTDVPEFSETPVSSEIPSITQTTNDLSRVVTTAVSTTATATHANSSHSSSPLPRQSANPSSTTSFSTASRPSFKEKSSKKFSTRSKLFVGNLPSETTKEDLLQIFRDYGEVGDVMLVPKKGFAFVKMDTKPHAEEAKDALNRSVVCGSRIVIRWAQNSKTTLWVGSIPLDFTNEKLYDSFSEFGSIERATCACEAQTRIAKGYGFVEFENQGAAQLAYDACQSGNFILGPFGKPVRVRWAELNEVDGITFDDIRHPGRGREKHQPKAKIDPHFTEDGSPEHLLALRWRSLYQQQEIEKNGLKAKHQAEIASLESMASSILSGGNAVWQGNVVQPSGGMRSAPEMMAHVASQRIPFPHQGMIPAVPSPSGVMPVQPFPSGGSILVGLEDPLALMSLGVSPQSVTPSAVLSPHTGTPLQAGTPIQTPYTGPQLPTVDWAPQLQMGPWISPQDANAAQGRGARW